MLTPPYAIAPAPLARPPTQKLFSTRYFIMNPDTRAELLDPANASEAVRLLKDFIQDDSPSMRDRFKVRVYPWPHPHVPPPRRAAARGGSCGA